MAVSSPYTAGSVMDSAASLLNDTAKTLFTYTVQLPYLKLAQQELEHELDLSGVTVNLVNSSEISVLAGATTLTLPSDFFLPVSLQEKGSGDTYFWLMFEVGNVEINTGALGPSLEVWDFRNNNINFRGATVNRTVKVFYTKLMTVMANDATSEVVVGANNALAYRTAALCAEFIGKDLDRAQSLNLYAAKALDTLVALYVGNQQGVRVRRKPFRFARGLGQGVIS